MADQYIKYIFVDATDEAVVIFRASDPVRPGETIGTMVARVISQKLAERGFNIGEYTYQPRATLMVKRGPWSDPTDFFNSFSLSNPNSSQRCVLDVLAFNQFDLFRNLDVSFFVYITP